MQYAIWDKDPEKVGYYRNLMLGALAGLQYADLNSRAGAMVRRAGMTAC